MNDTICAQNGAGADLNNATDSFISVAYKSRILDIKERMCAAKDSATRCKSRAVVENDSSHANDVGILLDVDVISDAQLRWLSWINYHSLQPCALANGNAVSDVDVTGIIQENRLVQY